MQGLSPRVARVLILAKGPGHRWGHTTRKIRLAALPCLVRSPHACEDFFAIIKRTLCGGSASCGVSWIRHGCPSTAETATADGHRRRIPWRVSCGATRAARPHKGRTLAGHPVDRAFTGSGAAEGHIHRCGEPTSGMTSKPGDNVSSSARHSVATQAGRRSSGEPTRRTGPRR
jgi:hypothetical protein